ncbi:MAG TPA: tyrosine--tRNA ligase [Candidatus Limnocylindrales bacterium]|nr:tyrosine--tRNA ligase [Candidatus Limnocylindrales bacterium]
MKLTVSEQLKKIKRGTVMVLPEEDLAKKIERSLKENKPLKVKLGCDPSRPDLHLGHTVVLRKLRQFQDLGHEAILVIGDFTGMIGDPSGRSKTRPALTLEETRLNGQSYFEQASKVLDPTRARIVYNSQWLGKMTFEDVIRLASKYTVARMLERDDFHNRFIRGEPISIHELLYPLAQAMDSVALQADVELGGTDQTFNLLVGRDIQREYGQEPQVIVTTPILTGLDGVEKMSKSLNNYVGITDPPQEMYGKILSIPDKLIYDYFELLTDTSEEELARIKADLQNPQVNPRDLKRRLAREIVTIYHSAEDAKKAEAEFDRIFVEKEVPSEIQEYTPEVQGDKIWIVKLLVSSGMATSNTDARRLIAQGAVSLNGERVQDENLELPLNRDFILKVGKRRFLKVVGRK